MCVCNDGHCEIKFEDVEDINAFAVEIYKLNRDSNSEMEYVATVDGDNGTIVLDRSL